MFFPVLTALLFLGIVAGIAGILLERHRNPAVTLARNSGARDALLAAVGWVSLVALHFAVAAIGEDSLNVRIKFLLGTLALLLLYYAVLATLRLIWRAIRRAFAAVSGKGRPVAWQPIPLLHRLAYPTLFVAALLAAATEYWYQGWSLNFFALAALIVMLALLPRRRYAVAAV
jgi:hypothetical protein